MRAGVVGFEVLGEAGVALAVTQGEDNSAIRGSLRSFTVLSRCFIRRDCTVSVVTLGNLKPHPSYLTHVSFTKSYYCSNS